MARGCLAQRYRIATLAEVADLLQSAAPSPLSPAPAVPAAAAALEASDEEDEDEDEDEEGEDAFFELDFNDAEEGAFSPAASPSRLAGPPQGGASGAFVGLLGSSASSAAASSSRRADAGAARAPAPGHGSGLIPMPPRAPLSRETLPVGGGRAAEEAAAITSLVRRGLGGEDVTKQILCGELPYVDVLALLQVLAPPPSLKAQLQQYGLTTKLELYVNDAGFERCWYAVTVKKIVSASPLLLSLEYT